MKFTLYKILADGEFVTIICEVDARNKEGKEFVCSNIEVFRVVEGKICEVWNPIHSRRPTGSWC